MKWSDVMHRSWMSSLPRAVWCGVLVAQGSLGCQAQVSISEVCSGADCPVDQGCELDGGAFCDCEGETDAGCPDSALTPSCSNTDCSGHGVCSTSDAGDVCVCETGYEEVGTQCLPIPTPDPCSSVTCSGHGTCAWVSGEVQCACNEGYIAMGNECVASTDPCAGVTCSGHGKCSAPGEVATCACDEGYEAMGTNCLAVVDPCADVECSGRGTCSGESGAITCVCDEGYRVSGLSCVALDGPCADVDCSGHGACLVVDGAPECDCDTGYVAETSDCVAADPCLGVTCSGQGTCATVSGAPSCTCFDGYRAVGAACVPESDFCTYQDCPQAKTCGVGSPTLYVSNSHSGNQQGTASEPFASIGAALRSAPHGAVVNVAQGVYTEVLEINDQVVHLCGGWSSDFAERDTSRFRPTLEGSTDQAVVKLIDAGDTTLVGFHITGGQAGVWVETRVWPAPREDSNPRISDNVIEENGEVTADGEASVGGLIVLGGYVSITANVIQNNQGGKGSALYLEGEEALVQANTFQFNTGGSDHGGGIYDAAAKLVFGDNLVRGNEAGALTGYGWGGGMIVLGAAALSDNVWTDNYTPSHGGALFVDEGAVADISNDLFYRNRCSDEGGDAIAIDGSGAGELTHVTATNLTVVDHDCNGGSAILMEANAVLTLHNSIVWNTAGTTDIFFQESNCRVEVGYSDYRTIAGQDVDGNVLDVREGNISQDPLFADPSTGDYHLRSTAGRFDPDVGDWVVDSTSSPALDGGDPASDYASEPVPNGARIDMGVFGGTHEASKSSNP